MTSPIEVRALKQSAASLEEIAKVFDVERREGEALRTWCRRIHMGIYRVELEYKTLRELFVDVEFEVRREQENAARFNALRLGMVP